MGRFEQGTGLALATTLFVAGCNGPERLKENVDTGIYGTPNVAATSEIPAIDPPNGCPPLESFRVLGPSTLGGTYEPPKVQGGGDKEGPDPNSYPPGTPMEAKNLGHCVLIQGAWLDSPADVKSGETFVISCIYDNPAEDLPPQLVIGTLNDDGGIAEAGFVKVTGEAAKDITDYKPHWLSYCVFPDANIPEVYPPVYPDQNDRPETTPPAGG